VLYVIAKRRITRWLEETFTPPDGSTPSRAALWFNTAAVILTQHLVAQAKATLLGMSSVDAKNEQREAVNANPVIGMLSSFLPKKLSKAIGGNPVLSNLVMSYVSKAAANMRNKGNTVHETSGSATQVPMFPLK
jgi:hypothetical protein